MICIVHAVVVPPMQRGKAYAHAANGECIVFTGEREKMIALCNEVRLYNYGTRSDVLVETDDWQGATRIDSSQCFVHPTLAA